MRYIQKLLFKTISINLLYYISSLSIILFILFKQELYGYEIAKYELILFIIIFIFSIYLESIKENIFLKVLILYSFIFYILCIPYSISIYEITFHVVRNVKPYQLPDALLILSYQYFVLFFAIYVINPTIRFSQKKLEFNEVNFLLNLLIFLSVANVLFNVFSYIDYDSYLKIFAVFFNIFNSTKIVFTFTALILLILISKTKVNNLISKSIFLYTVFLIDTIHAGSRSSIIFLILVVILSVFYYLNLKRLTILHLLSGLFLGVFVLLTFYASTIIRGYHYEKLIGFEQMFGKVKDPTTYKFSYLEWFLEMFTGSWQGSIHFITQVSRGVLDRISYFDFYLEKLINIKYYSELISLSYYYKPLLDRITPGFDLYNVPLAAKSLQNTYFKKYTEENNLEIYVEKITNSEQITIFAESHILFGFYSIIYYFIIFYLLKILLNFLKKINSQVSLQILNMTVLLLFFDWLTGFGMDFAIMLTLYHIVFLSFIFFIFRAYLILKK